MVVERQELQSPPLDRIRHLPKMSRLVTIPLVAGYEEYRAAVAQCEGDCGRCLGIERAALRLQPRNNGRFFGGQPHELGSFEIRHVQSIPIVFCPDPPALALKRSWNRSNAPRSSTSSLSLKP